MTDLPRPAKQRRFLSSFHGRSTPLSERFIEATGRLIVFVGDSTAGQWIETGIPVIVGFIGIAQAFGVIRSWGWAVAAAVLLVLDVVLVQFRRGSALRTLMTSFRRASGEYAGQLDTIIMRLKARPSRTFSESDCKTLCVGLLSRLHDFAEVSLGDEAHGKLRATLAVPLENEQSKPYAVRVWAYDRPYPERRWTRLPFGLVGAPRAFELGRVEIIPDLHLVTGISHANDRPYRSVVSIPVKAGGPDGATLAVVSLDCMAPNFFQKERVKQELVPIVQHLVNTIALVLTLRKPGEPYEFEQ